ncbi:MAG: DNA-protecting protein DprA [Gammaproteobacteria bacterium]|nr:DNA-protecting protein DprA [Gammaproteobacteria bacterium]
MTATPTTVALLSLLKLRGLGRRTALRIVDQPIRETDLPGCREAVLSCVSRLRRVSVSASEFSDAWAESEEQLDLSHDLGIQAISFHDALYPERLKKIPDPPAVLFVKGKIDGLHATKCLAVVGTREPTSYGKAVASRSARTAVEAGFIIVSGLANGCDTYAHEGCLETHGVGVAVLAHGLDMVYPATNRDLAERLVELEGCLVSEYPIGFGPIQASFAERDRIQSGLSDAVLVIETDLEGGTVHTVRFARDQNRPLACIAHPDELLSEVMTKGNQKFIKEGWATPIPNGDELERYLSGLTRAVSGGAAEVPGGDSDQQQMSLPFQPVPVKSIQYRRKS